MRARPQECGLPLLTYRTRRAFSRSDTARTALAFLAPFALVWYPNVTLMSLVASFPAKVARAPGTFGSSTWNTSDSVYVRPALSRAFLAFCTLSTTTCTAPSALVVVVRKARMFTFASPSVLATFASVPGRFSTETVSCFAFGMGGPLPARRIFAKVTADIPVSQSGGLVSVVWPEFQQGEVSDFSGAVLEFRRVGSRVLHEMRVSENGRRSVDFWLGEAGFAVWGVGLLLVPDGKRFLFSGNEAGACDYTLRTSRAVSRGPSPRKGRMPWHFRSRPMASLSRRWARTRKGISTPWKQGSRARFRVFRLVNYRLAGARMAAHSLLTRPQSCPPKFIAWSSRLGKQHSGSSSGRPIPQG